MADPISLALGVASLGIQSIQISKKLLEFLVDVKGAPDALRRLVEEIESFEHVLRSLDLVLQNPKVRSAVYDNMTVAEAVQSLIRAVSRCRSILDQLNLKVERLCRSRTRQSSVQSSLVGIKWSLYYKKNEFQGIQRSLKVEKTTLVVALNFLNM